MPPPTEESAHADVGGHELGRDGLGQDVGAQVRHEHVRPALVPGDEPEPAEHGTRLPAVGRPDGHRAWAGGPEVVERTLRDDPARPRMTAACVHTCSISARR